MPFEPLAVAFQDVQYYVDTPLVTILQLDLLCNSNVVVNILVLGYLVSLFLYQEMRKRGFKQRKLRLLSDITGAFRPGILTALMGVSGAGKTTLLDVLSGRKTGGTIEGEIRIGGYLKVQDIFARVSGYCEQTDIHSPQITVEESLIFSAWLRLPSHIDLKTKAV